MCVCVCTCVCVCVSVCLCVCVYVCVCVRGHIYLVDAIWSGPLEMERTRFDFTPDFKAIICPTRSADNTMAPLLHHLESCEIQTELFM